VVEVDAQSQTIMVAAGQTTAIASGSPPAAVSETPAPARALRITLGTRDNMYVCDGIGRCVGMLPVLGVPVAIQVNQLPGSVVTGPTADVNSVIVPDPAGTYYVTLQAGMDGSEDGTPYQLEAAVLSGGDAGTPQVFAGTLFQ